MWKYSNLMSLVVMVVTPCSVGTSVDDSPRLIASAMGRDYITANRLYASMSANGIEINWCYSEKQGSWWTLFYVASGSRIDVTRVLLRRDRDLERNLLLLDPMNSEDLYFSIAPTSTDIVGGLSPLGVPVTERALYEGVKLIITSVAYRTLLDTRGTPVRSAVVNRTVPGSRLMLDVFMEFSTQTRRYERLQLVGSQVHLAGVIERWPDKRYGDEFKRRELVDGATTTLIWDGSDYLQGRS